MNRLVAQDRQSATQCARIAIFVGLVCTSLAVAASEDDILPTDESLAEVQADSMVAVVMPEIPVAPNVDLKAEQPDGIEHPVQTSKIDTKPAPKGRSVVVLGTEVEPSTSTRLSWSASESFEGIAADTPVLVVNGSAPGPVLCVTAAVHGDELNGIEMVRRLFYEIDPEKLRGTLIGVPIVNLDGFRRNSRYLTDRRDLNRFFPGNPQGSTASRVAHSFFNKIVLHCEALVDLHTGSFHRTNLPQLRANLKDARVREMAEGFGSMVVLHSVGAKGTLRRAASKHGIPAVTLEAGEPLRLENKAVDKGVKGLRHLLRHMDMYGKRSNKVEREPHYYKSLWIRADTGGILFSNVSLGDRVKPGKLLGTVTDPITNVRDEIRSEVTGRVLGMALNQVLMPGFAAYRIGIQTTEEEMQSAKANSATKPEAELVAQAAPSSSNSTPDSTTTKVERVLVGEVPESNTSSEESVAETPVPIDPASPIAGGEAAANEAPSREDATATAAPAETAIAQSDEAKPATIDLAEPEQASDEPVAEE